MNKLLVLLLLTSTLLFGSLKDKSAIVYYGQDISYPLVGIHDYIIVEPQHIDTATHGFKTYKKNIYAYVSIGEIDRDIPAYKYINKKWIATQNKAWSSDVLDITNTEYQEFIFKHQIEPKISQGFENFFFDTLDSYYLYAKTPQKIEASEKALAAFINEFHKRYPHSKLIINRGFEIIDEVHNAVTAVLFESYYHGIGGSNLSYTDVSDADREWLEIYLKKIRRYNLDIIAVDYLQNIEKADDAIDKLQAKGFIPYIANKNLDIYGKSAKNAHKREILTLIDESRLDRTLLEAHQYGALVFEYLGYVQKLHDIRKGLPDPKKIKNRYTGVVIWLQDYIKKPKQYIQWLRQLQKEHIPFVFVNNFGFDVKSQELAFLGIHLSQNPKANKTKISYQDAMIGYEIQPSMSYNSKILHLDSNITTTPLLEYTYTNQTRSTPAALTQWGGYIVDESFMVEIGGDNLWITDPFAFFTQALHLQKLPVPDTTTHNGLRLFFSHIDGDGIMNKVEGKFGKYSGDAILNHILKKYPVPHSVSVIGAEIDPHGLYPKISAELIEIVKKMYALPNVEGASHTFTHPFFWGKIHNGTLDKKYRLKVKGYNFSLKRELETTLQNINTKYYPKNKLPPADTIFWSGDCAPRVDALSFVAKHNIKAINGGDTTIQRTAPWLSRIAPLGLQRKNFIQVYTGAQNENVFTNDWLGPFWGFKRVTQTFALTNSPRRFKPIDIYYHLYSGSKRASLEALKYVFDWSLKQKTFKIFTSTYIPKVKDFYTASLADEQNKWLFKGLQHLKTVRLEDTHDLPDLQNSSGVLGYNHFEKHTYVTLEPYKENYLLTLTPNKQTVPYLRYTNAKITHYSHTQKRYTYELEKSFSPIEIELAFPSTCNYSSIPHVAHQTTTENIHTLTYSDKAAKVHVSVTCQ